MTKIARCGQGHMRSEDKLYVADSENRCIVKVKLKPACIFIDCP